MLFDDEREDLKPSEPLVLLIGSVDYEGITSMLKVTGQQYKKKMLASSPENWNSILDYFDEFSIAAVVLKLNGDSYDRIISADYAEIGKDLFERISIHRHIAFVYEELLHIPSESREPSTSRGTQFWEGTDPFERSALDLEDFESYRHLQFSRPSKDTVEGVNSLLRTTRLNVVPYTRNAQLTVIAIQFLQDALEKLIFRVYVPAGRMWADEVDRLLQLSRDYLRQNQTKGSRSNKSEPNMALLYEFHGEDSTQISLSSEFKDFSQLLDLLLTDPVSAAHLLERKNVDAIQIGEIVTRYTKEAKRLQVDLKHDRERKLLGIRQRLNENFTDVLPASADSQMLDAIVARVIPSVTNFRDAYLLPMPASERVSSSVTVNLNPQIVQSVTGIVAQEIRGGINLTEEDNQLLDLIREHGGTRAVECASAVHELADPSIPKPKRLTSAQKLKAFLYSIGSHLGGVGAEVLQKYSSTSWAYQKATSSLVRRRPIQAFWLEWLAGGPFKPSLA